MLANDTLRTEAPWIPPVFRVPKPVRETLSAAQRNALASHIKRLLRARDAVLVAHYYVDADLQIVAEETGGYVSDSLEMARFGHRHG